MESGFSKPPKNTFFSIFFWTKRKIFLQVRVVAAPFFDMIFHVFKLQKIEIKSGQKPLIFLFKGVFKKGQNPKKEGHF